MMGKWMEAPTDWAAKWALYSPEKIAFQLAESGETLTFRDLHQRGNRVAHLWRKIMGLAVGDRVGVLAENCLELVVLFVAAQKSGCVLVPLNYRLSAKEIAHLLENAQPRMLIVEEQFAGKVKGVDVGEMEHWTLQKLSSYIDPQHHTATGQYDPTYRAKENDPVLILYTSGSTGFPKGVLYTHKMLFWNSVNTAFSLVLNAESRTVSCMPPFHTGGWNVLLTPFFHHGGFTCLMKKFEANRVLELLAQERATIFMGVPTMLKMIADVPAFSETPLPDLLYVLSGGEPCPLPLIDRWHTKKIYIRQGYGMTEAGPNLFSLHQDDAKSHAGSIGRPNFMVETRVVDEAGNDCPVSTTGELLIKGPMVTPGYWQNGEATRNTIVEGWLHTGDLVQRTAEEYYYVVDRIKNMFISGGENVYPAEVERALLEHPAIREVAVIGVTDERWGEVGKGFLVVEGKLSDEEIRSFCRDRLAKYKIPKHFERVVELPKGDTGKIDRKALG